MHKFSASDGAVQIASQRWPAGGNVLSKRRRMSIAIAIALVELLALVWLLYESSRVPAMSKQLGGGDGLLSFSSATGNGTSLTMHNTPAMKTVATSPAESAATPEKTDIEKPHPNPPTPSIPYEEPQQASTSATVAKSVASGTQRASDNSQANGQGSPSGSAGAGGGDYYDPYAGAMPQYRANNDVTVTGPEQLAIDAIMNGSMSNLLGGGALTKEDEADIALIAQLRDDVIKRFPGSHGYLLLMIRTDPKGQIVDAEATRSSIAPFERVIVAHMLLGRTMATQHLSSHELPLLQW